MPYSIVPAINFYGNTELPLSRGAVFYAEGSLEAETRYQYQVNSEGIYREPNLYPKPI